MHEASAPLLAAVVCVRLFRHSPRCINQQPSEKEPTPPRYRLGEGLNAATESVDRPTVLHSKYEYTLFSVRDTAYRTENKRRIDFCHAQLQCRGRLSYSLFAACPSVTVVMRQK